MRVILAGLMVVGCGGSTPPSTADGSCTVGADNGNPDDNRPDVSGCDPDEACVVGDGRALDEDGDLMFSCVELQRTPPPADGFGVPGQDGWATHEVASARCNNGERARFWFRPAVDAGGATAGSDRWLIFLRGGGGCSDARDCATRWQTHPALVRPPGAGQVPAAAGVFAAQTSSGELNELTAAHQVYVHYCSSDVWRGVGQPDDEDGRSPSTGLFHHGHRVVEEVADALVQGLSYDGATHRLASGADVVLAGSSAGSSGVASNVDALAVRLAEAGVEAEVRAVLDSAIRTDVRPPGQVNREPDYAEAMDAHCEAAHGGGAEACRSPLHLVTGRGLAGPDDGHVGQQPDDGPASTDHFVYMSASDGKLYPAGGICTPRQCSVDGDCPDASDRCDEGRCLRPVEVPAEAPVCDHGSDAANLADPLGLACFADGPAGSAGPLAELDEALVTRCRSALEPSSAPGESFAPVDVDGDCGAAMTCMGGSCVRTEHEVMCDRDLDCPGVGDTCFEGSCVHAAERQARGCRDLIYSTGGPDSETCSYRPPGGCHVASCPRPLDTCTELGMCEHAAGADGSCADVIYELDPQAMLCTTTAGCRSDADCLDGEICIRGQDMPAGGATRAGVVLPFERPDLPVGLSGYTIRTARERHTILASSDGALFEEVTWDTRDGATRTLSVYDALLEWLDDGGSEQVRLIEAP